MSNETSLSPEQQEIQRAVEELQRLLQHNIPDNVVHWAVEQARTALDRLRVHVEEVHTYDHREATTVTVRAAGTPVGSPQWLDVIFAANRVEPGMFGNPQSHGWQAGEYVEEYADARVFLTDTDAQGNVRQDSSARIVSKTERGARALAQAATNLGINFG